MKPWGRSLNSMNIYLFIIIILDVEHSPYYIALGLTQTHKVI